MLKLDLKIKGERGKHKKFSWGQGVSSFNPDASHLLPLDSRGVWRFAELIRTSKPLGLFFLLKK